MIHVFKMFYMLTIFVMVAAFTINITVRAKNLTAVSSLAKQRSTTIALAFVLAFNMCDYLIIYFENYGFNRVITGLYVWENLLEIGLVYTVIRMAREYVSKPVSHWTDILFIADGILALCGDGIFIASIANSEIIYATYMSIVNAIPIIVLLCYTFRFWRWGKKTAENRFTDTYLLIYSMFCIMLSVIITLNTIDARTEYNFFAYDKEVYLLAWLAFNVYNFIFAWKTLSVDIRTETERIQNPEEKINFVAERYALSAREKEIARMLYDGKNNKEIASELFLSLNTIKVHTSNLYKKLDVTNRVQAVQIIRGEGIIK